MYQKEIVYKRDMPLGEAVTTCLILIQVLSLIGIAFFSN